MEHNLQLTIALLERTPSALDALLRDLPAKWVSQNEGGDTWSVTEVIAHLVYGEQVDWVPRAKLILATGESQAFEPFDRLGHLKACDGKTLAELLDAFRSLRLANLNWLRRLDLQPMDLERKGLHPAFGSVSLSELLATWAVHDMTHLRQIARIMAHQYRDAVGPWKQYLGVLQTANRSS